MSELGEVTKDLKCIRFHARCTRELSTASSKASFSYISFVQRKQREELSPPVDVTARARSSFSRPFAFPLKWCDVSFR